MLLFWHLGQRSSSVSVRNCCSWASSLNCQVSIAGFHGLELGRARLEKLASVVTPRYEIGRAAGDALIKRLSGGEAADRIDLGYQIYYGDTL